MLALSCWPTLSCDTPPAATLHTTPPSSTIQLIIKTLGRGCVMVISSTVDRVEVVYDGDLFVSNNPVRIKLQ